jgi:thymidylate synthase
MVQEFIPYMKADSIDDLMRQGLESICEHGTFITPSKGRCQELTGVTLELTRPRARISQSASRGKMVSALGELSWYLAGNDDARFMNYYVPGYEKYADDGITVHGAYGPRIFGSAQPNQFQVIKALLQHKSDSRQAIVQIFEKRDTETQHKDIPCTCSFQFMVRDSRLNLIVYMRSNDIIKGFAHDVFSFTMMQELMARSLDLELGTYKHVVGSFHLYDTARDIAEQYLAEGYHQHIEMPQMPAGDPWSAIELFLKAEADARCHDQPEADLSALHPYWADLVRVLQAYKFSKSSSTAEIERLLVSLSDDFYSPFIVGRR